MDAATRYFAKIDRSAGWDACHPWTGGKGSDGYGTFRLSTDETIRATRFGWSLAYGYLPEGWGVLHHCDTPLCQNPLHWFPGTNADNMADKLAKRRQARLRGESNGQAKLTEADVIDIRSRYTGRRGEQIALAREYDVTATAIRLVVKGRAWRHVS